METNKITPKPIVHADRINKARDISGLRKRMRDSRFIGGVVSFLGWFTIPAEVFLRRRFGYRWFTPLNFYAGLFLLVAVTFIQLLVEKGWSWISETGGSWNPLYSSKSYSGYVFTADMALFLGIYIVMGVYHLFKRWWRSQANIELHSYDDGTSFLEPVGGFMMKVINGIAIPLIDIYLFFDPERKKEFTSRHKLINDRAAFTNTILEPLVFFYVAYNITFSVEAIWLYITAFAVAISANMKETAKRTRVLDFKDSMLEAKAMSALKNGEPEEEKKSAKTTKKESKKQEPEVRQNYPDLRTIIAELHQEKQTIILYDRG